MRAIQWARALFLLLFLPVAVLQAQAPLVVPGNGAQAIRVSYVFSDTHINGTLDAYRDLMGQHPEWRGRVQLQMLTESTFSSLSAAQLAQSDVFIVDLMNEALLKQFQEQHKIDVLAMVGKSGHVIGVGDGVQGQEAYQQMGIAFDAKAKAYWAHGGPQNRLSLLKLALLRAGAQGLTPAEPQPSLEAGYYAPDGGDGKIFADWETYLAWRKSAGDWRADAPNIAIGFYKDSYYSGDTQLLNALIAEVERQGGNAIAVFGYPGAQAFRHLLGEGTEGRADAALGLFFQFNDMQSAKILAEVDIPVINLISLYGRSEADWRNSATGLTAFEGTFNVAAPELAGTIAPTVVGTKEKLRDPASGLTNIITKPIGSRVEMAVSRAMRYAKLRKKDNADKKLAILYYNYPAGKAGISASYLNVAQSLITLLRELQKQGYDVGDDIPDAEVLLADLTQKARNINGDAPGELTELLSHGAVTKISMEQYHAWLKTLAPTLAASVVKDWGQPENSRLMTVQHNGETQIVLPRLQFGKVVLMPQPARAWGEDVEKLHNAKGLAPHHQYIAAYHWIKQGFGGDAIVHLGTHGTLEWLDGRDAGLAEDDASDALIGDMPHGYIYNVDVVGEGLVARRRSAAVLVDHMVPPFVKNALSEDLAKLSELLNDHTKNEGKNVRLAKYYADQARDLAIKLGVAKDIGINPSQSWTDEQLHELEEYLLELRAEIIPYGLHAFGRTPTDDAIASTAEAVVAVDRDALPDARRIAAADMQSRIRQSGPSEISGILKMLSGRFVPAGLGGEPIRNPDAYPTGKNFYGVDPDKIPKPAAWEMGSALAEQMLQEHRQKHGSYPSKISFIIWGDETMRHEGVLESQIFYMLGTKPVWDERGKLVDVAVIPREQLGRPRVDIVIASAAEGLFGNLTRMLDAAVQKVKLLDEPDNQVRRHYLATKDALIARGIAPDEAEKMAGVRIFDEPPGSYNLNTSSIVAKSGSWNDESAFVNDYIRKMGHGYGNGYWGQPMPDVFSMAISGTNSVVHSSSTSLYGALDNDDMFMYMGGLSSAIRGLDGKSPEMFLTDSRDPAKASMISAEKFVGREFRSRYVNPQWIKGMQKEGYAGAGAIKEFVEYLWGWDATSPDVISDTMWQESFETYVEDKYKLGMKEFFGEKSPYAFQDITARMIETVRKGYWKVDEATRRKLVREYFQNVAEYGTNCTDVSCGNARLLQYALQEAESAGVPAADIAKVRAAFEKAIGRNIDVAAAELADFADRNDARAKSDLAQRPRSAVASPASAPPSSSAPAQKRMLSAPQSPAAQSLPNPNGAPAEQGDVPLQGQLMVEEDRTQQAPIMPKALELSVGLRDALWPLFGLAAILLWWRRRDLKGGALAA